jgi:2,5-diketo-D-gluconate reductase A
METVVLNNGVEMPILGFGVYQVAPEDCERVVSDALEAGYRLIDTAAGYGNEIGVGRAIAASGVPREELFVTTKVWVSDAGKKRTRKAFARSLERLGLDYLDLYLIHQPFGDYYGSWRAMERLLADGDVRSIGVSNFHTDRLLDLTLHNDVVPAVNQIETHPFHQRHEDRELMDELGVQHESWGPFAEGRHDLFTHPVLSEIAEGAGRTVGQVVLRWLVQRGVVAIPKSVRRERMDENLAVFDFELSEADMARIAELDLKESAFFSHRDPAMVEMLGRSRVD